MSTIKAFLKPVFLLLVCLGVVVVPRSVPALAACALSGDVYRDFNATGTHDNVFEPGVEGITVTAYLPDGTVGDTATTLADGTYTLTITQNVPQVRVEFTNIPPALRSGPFGGQSDTTVSFVDCNAAPPPVNLAVANPGQYCHTDNPTLATSCFVVGDPQAVGAANQPTMITFPYTAGAATNVGPPYAPFDAPAHPTIAFAPQTGSVFGIAHQRTTDVYFASAHMKRHTGFGPGAGGAPSSGAIYRITQTGVVTLLIDLNTVAGINTGADPHPPAPSTPLDWQIDAASFPLVGKIALGDLDISEDDRTLYTVNLNQRTLISIPIATPGAAVSRAIPNPGCVNGQMRPFGLGVQDLVVYIGVVCDATGAGATRANLDAYVIGFNTLTNAFLTVFQMDLDYPRRCTDSAPGCAAARAADWLPWEDNWVYAVNQPVIHPQPMLVDIEFNNGDMILGFRDRIGAQGGNRQRSPIAADINLYSTTGAGDILRACSNGAGGWVLEANGTCGAITTAGSAGDFVGQGPGTPGGEYYYTDNNALNPYVARHDEISLGGILQLPGAPDVASTAFDPVPNNGQLFDAGIVWMNNETGDRTRSYRIVNGTQNDPTQFGKGEGLGSLEAACGPAPLEIGNRVWEDLDQNGQQDPGEMPLAGVIVTLYDGAGVFIANTTTNAKGEYIFNAADVFNAADTRTWLDINGDGLRTINEPAGILPETTYTIRLDNPANYGGGPLTLYRATANDLVVDRRDSDGIVPNFAALVSTTNVPEVTLTTGIAGENDHTYDFGFHLPVPTPTPGVVVTPPPSTPGVSGSYMIYKSVSPPFAGPGDTVTWTITVTNTGSIPVTNVPVSDTLPVELQIQSTNASSGTASVSGQTVSWVVPILNPGASATLNIVTKVDPNLKPPFSITNLASVDVVPPAESSATLLSVRRLPSTGESPTIPPLLLVIGALMVGLAVVVGGRTWRRSQ